MKLKLLIIFLLPGLCYITSCQKQLNDPGNTGSKTVPGSNKLKLYIEDGRQSSLNEIDTFNVNYDGNNRITSLVAADLKFVFGYNSNNSGTIDLYNTTQLSVHEILFLNGASLLDSTFQYNDTNDTTTEKYIYSGNVLVRQIEYQYSLVTGIQITTADDYTYDGNRNLIKDIQTDGAGNVESISTFTYTNHAINFSIGSAFIPVQNTDLPATKSLEDGSGNKIASVTYSYVFDSSDRVTKETDTLDNGAIFIKSYVYY